MWGWMLDDGGGGTYMSYIRLLLLSGSLSDSGTNVSLGT